MTFVVARRDTLGMDEMRSHRTGGQSLGSVPVYGVLNEGETHGLRGNTVATSTSFRTVQPVQDFAPGRTIWTSPDTTSAALARLRALWRESSVGVRVSLGAFVSNHRGAPRPPRHAA